MRYHLALLIVGVTAASSQAVSQYHFSDDSHPHIADVVFTDILVKHSGDPVAALVEIHPELTNELAEKRLLKVERDDARWMTEGDKLQLRRDGHFFIDLTNAEPVSQQSAQPHLPKITHQRFVRPCFKDISINKMREVLQHMTGYYNRYYHSITGAQSAIWLHNHIADIIQNSPAQTYISLEYHTHSFLQSSIVARFEPPVRNASLPLTIVGAHQDSANYLFPLLPAPGADDDCSGTVSILETFRVLASRGYIPEGGPVEFHWYAAEEAGLLGSRSIAEYKKGQGAKIGAMLEFDMTAFIARNSTETIAFVRTDADSALTDWCADLAKEYSALQVKIVDLPPGAGSDYMSFTRQGYPSAFATEGDPTSNRSRLGDFDPYVHGTEDRMDIDDETGVFSIDHMARFSEYAIAFVVEQAGWSLKHTRAEDPKL